MTNIYGNDNNNALKGAGAADELYGGAGNDLGFGGIYTAFAGDGSVGNPFSNPTMDPSGDDTLEGGSGADGLYGADGDDAIYGGEGDDAGSIVFGTSYYKAGLFGGDGGDLIDGGGGDDEITGGLGQDDMFGGTGADTFFFNAIEEIGKGSKSDFIGDFRGKQGDIIDLSAIDANGNKGGDQKFKWIGDDKFSKAGQVSFENGKVKINTDNDKAAEAVIVVNTNKMDADDFLF